jgi:transposase
MTRPSKLTPDITKRIGDGVSLGLTYSLAAESAGVTYQTFNQWMQRGRNSTSGEYFKFLKYITKCNADAAKMLLERLNEAAVSGNCQICMWILERRFPEEFGRWVYRKMNVVSENRNENVKIIVQDTDAIRKEILAKFDRVGELQESQINSILPSSVPLLKYALEIFFL